MRGKFTSPSTVLRVSLIVLCISITCRVSAVMAVTSATGELSATSASRAIAVSGATPVLISPSGMKVQPGETADQVVQATDAGGDPLTFSKGSGPAYMTVTT